MNDLTTLVRRSLDDRSGDLPAVPPAWDRISAGLRAVRRRRRRRTAGLVAAVAAVAVLGAGLSGVTPVTLRQSGPATPDGRVRADSVFGGRTVGSLAPDREFLADLRREVVAGLTFGESRPQANGPEDVLVAFAGDVGDVRVAMVEVVVGRDDGVKNRFVWLTAPQGASAAELARHPSSIEDAGPVTSLWTPTASGDAAPEGRGALVVLSSRREGGDLQLAAPPEINAEGRVEWGLWSAEPSSPGHWETPVPYQLKTVTAGWWAMQDAADWTEMTLAGVDGSGMGYASTTALHGGAPAVGPAAAMALERAQEAARLDVAQSLRTLLWSGPVKGGTVSVVAVTVPSGAHVLSVSRLEADASPGAFSAPFVRPAGPLEDLCLAMFDDDGNGGDPGLFVLGPVGAVRAVVGGRTPGTVLTDEVASVPVQAPDGSRVDFVDAAGRTLCSTTVNGTSDTFVPHA